MGIVTLTSARSITIQAVTRRSWALPSSGEIGKLTLSLPYSSPAAADAYVNDGGGSLVTVASESDSGDWRGIVTEVDYGQDAVDITAMHPIAILKERPVSQNRTIPTCNVSFVARTALNDALGGLAGFPLSVGPIAETPPTMTNYLLRGEMCWSVIQDLMNLSGFELNIIPYSSVAITRGRGNRLYTEYSIQPDQVTWGAPLTYNFPTTLVAPSTLRNVRYVVGLIGQAVEALVVGDSDWFRATNAQLADGAHWPAARVIKEKFTSDAAMKTRGEAELDQASGAAVALAGDLTTANWHIREGDIVRVIVPWARFGGVTLMARVLTREINDATGLMGVTLAVAEERAQDAVVSVQGAKRRGKWWRQIETERRRAAKGNRFIYE